MKQQIENKKEFDKLNEKELKKFLNAKKFLEKSKNFKSMTNYNNKENICLEDVRDYIFLNNSNVIGICFKDYLGFNLLVDFYEENVKDNKIPQLKYDGVAKKCAYGCDLIKFAITLCEKLDDRVCISVKKDYPATIENKHIKIFVAPRGDE
ncbi:MAG: hypothetical protein ACOCP8_04360 [archaeon]